jgi:hypothetical protein
MIMAEREGEEDNKLGVRKDSGTCRHCEKPQQRNLEASALGKELPTKKPPTTPRASGASKILLSETGYWKTYTRYC